MNSREERGLSFLNKAVVVHGDKYSYDLSTYTNQHSKIRMWCRACYKFATPTPRNILSGSGCLFCGRKAIGNSKRASLGGFISASQAVHGNKYDYSGVNYVGNRVQVVIRCRQHDFTFKQIPSNHLKGKGCRKCQTDKQKKERALTLEQFLERAISVHGNTYDYSNSEYINSHTKVMITCKTHGDFPQTPCIHLSKGAGCPKCADYGKGCFSERSIERDKERFLKEDNTLYLIRLRDLGKDVYKIGISTDLSTRVSSLKTRAGHCEVVHRLDTCSYIAYKLEVYLHDLLRSKRFIPEVKFGGYTELFTLDHEYVVFIKEFLEDVRG